MNGDEQKDSDALRELKWLAQYFYKHGFKEKAQEILDRIGTRRDSNNVVDIFENDEERRA